MSSPAGSDEATPARQGRLVQRGQKAARPISNEAILIIALGLIGVAVLSVVAAGLMVSLGANLASQRR